MQQAVVTRDVHGVRRVKTWLQVTESPAKLAGDWRYTVLAISCRYRSGIFGFFAPDAEEIRKHRKNLDGGRV
jgi:hypothetical protein